MELFIGSDVNWRLNRRNLQQVVGLNLLQPSQKPTMLSRVFAASDVNSRLNWRSLQQVEMNWISYNLLNNPPCSLGLLLQVMSIRSWTEGVCSKLRNKSLVQPPQKSTMLSAFCWKRCHFESWIEGSCNKSKDWISYNLLNPPCFLGFFCCKWCQFDAALKDSATSWRIKFLTTSSIHLIALLWVFCCKRCQFDGELKHQVESLNFTGGFRRIDNISKHTFLQVMSIRWGNDKIGSAPKGYPPLF